MATTINDSGFFGIVDFSSPSKEIVSVGYDPGVTKYTAPWLIVVQPVDFLIYQYIDGVKTDPAVKIRTEFDAFLQTLYGAGASLTSNSIFHDLNSDMEANDLTDQYADVEVVDFMAFTGAIDRYQTLPDGSLVDCLNITPGSPRPNLNGLVSKEDFSLMYQIIEHLGIQGIYPYLYAKEGINFKQFCDRLRIWKQDTKERTDYIYQKLIPLLRTPALKAPVLTEAQVLELVKV